MLLTILSLFLFCDPALAAKEKPKARGPACGSPKVSFLTNDKITGVPGILCRTLVKVANTFGPVTINSGFRTEKENRERGGAEDSAHLKQFGGAFDFSVEGIGPSSAAKQKQLALLLLAIPGIRHNVYCSGSGHIDITKRKNGYKTCVKY
jgi:hypothetical protein